MRNHRDHIHAAYAKGGMVKPFVADSGATLRPGLNVLDNQTGGPEPLGRLDQPMRLAPATIDDLAAAVGDEFMKAVIAQARKNHQLGRTIEGVGV